jgi:uncharacterized protein
MAQRHVVGLISDTHGLLRPQVHDALAGVEVILHAGDVGGDEILDELGLIAPVYAVCGNTDPRGDPRLQQTLVHMVGDLALRVAHGHELGSPTPDGLFARYAEPVVIFGHTHRALVHHERERWAINPGAAGPRRFDLLPTVGRLTIEGASVDVQIIEL